MIAMTELATSLIKFVLYGYLLRLLFEFHRVDYYHPISQTLAKLTNPLYLPVRAVVPIWRGVDLPLLLIVLALKLLILYTGPLGSAGASIHGMVLFAGTQLVVMALNLYLICLVLVVVSSWLQLSVGAETVVSALRALSAPMLVRIRSVLPDTGLIDFSPMVAMIGILVAQNLLGQLSRLVLRL